MTDSVRTRLPDRRRSEFVDFAFHRVVHTAQFARGEDGRILELFIHCNKPSSSLGDAARDGAIGISFALQYGAPVAALAAAVTLDEDGSPAGIVGAALIAIMGAS